MIFASFFWKLLSCSQCGVNSFLYGSRSDLSVPRLRPSADSSPARSSPPLNPLRFSASRPLRPPLLFLRRWRASNPSGGQGRAVRSAPLRETCLCSAPPPQAPAELHSGRFRSSPLRSDGTPHPASEGMVYVGVGRTHKIPYILFFSL